MSMHFLAISGPDKGRVYQLNEGCPQTVGRSHAHAEIVLQDTDVARVQCQVAMEGGDLVVTDLDGANATFVNEQAINECRMKPGDVLRIGQSRLQLQMENVGRPVAVATPQSIPVVTPQPVVSAVATLAAQEGMAPSLLSGPDRLLELIGTTLGHFEIGPLLGRGHTGAVFQARDVKSLRTVALRVLPAEFPKNDAERQRFVEGVKSMLPLEHPHLVKLYGAGKAGAYHWLASEYVEGENLAAVVKRGRPTGPNVWQPVHRVALHIGWALQYAHEHHFVHRNLTPSDILIVNGDNLAKLNDLVMFKALEGSALRQVSLRAKMASDLAYFSPEQTYGGARVDARSDLFSFGSVLYAMLMGRPPFAGESQADTVRRIREAPPASPRKLHPLFPRLFESILLKMLAKPPEHRFQTAGELLAALQQIGHN
jgi:eukaryotic-like serine/threonine-protein kinase